MNPQAFARAAILLLAPSALFASDFPDLKRLEPVPAGQQVPIVDFVRPNLFRDVQLNHLGTHVGAIVPNSADSMSLVLFDLATKKTEGVAAQPGDFDISSFLWLDGKRLAYVVSQRKYVGRVLGFSEAGRLATAERVQPQAGESSVSILADLVSDRSQLLANLAGPRVRYNHLELVDAANAGNLVERYPDLKTDHGFNVRYLPDKAGRLAFGITQEDGILALNKLSGDRWIKCPEDLDETNVLESGDEPGQVVVLGRRDGNGPRPLEFMDAETGRPGDIIFQDKTYDFSGSLFRDPKSLAIVGAVYDRAGPHVAWFTGAYRDLQAAADKLFPQETVRILGMDDQGKILLLSVGSDRQPLTYSWIDLDKHTCSLIENSEPWIDPKRMLPMGILKYQTAEGRPIDAYLTVPAGTSKANPAPMVVLPPAGSSGRWTWEFNSEVQFLASRGYAVLQPNHRGSAGYGWMYPEEEDWDFRKMSDDVAAATRKAVATGLVDPRRVAIMGQSFGGYLAVSGVTFEPGLYKCALAVSAFVDWGDYIKQDRYLQFSNPTYSRFLYKLGDPEKNPARYMALSPLPNADQIHAPVFLAWGEYDNPEMIGEDERLASALKKNGVAVETRSFLNEASGIHHLEHRIELYQSIEAFLAKNL
jgi:dipeptidyl aminopeptidase/acylaminoacyl peptidase